MSSPHRYQKASTGYTSEDGDSQDDLDFDLDELDPEAARPSSERQGANRRGTPSMRGPGIALRTLRSNAHARLFNKSSPRRSEENAEDLQGLLDEQGDQQRPSSHGADSPLLRAVSEPTYDKGSNLVDRSSAWLSGTFKNVARKLHLSDRQDIRLSESSDGDSETRNLPTRTIAVGQAQATKFPPNIVSNAKYTPWSFLPRTLYNEFSFFFNIYFLLVALSQTIPVLRIGYLSSYIAPLAFVVSISLGKEAVDDIARRRRDAEANSEEFIVLSFPPSSESYDNGGAPTQQPIEAIKKSRDLKVGDIVKLRKDQRVPADVIVLKSTPGDAAYSDAPNEFEEPQQKEEALFEGEDEDASSSAQNDEDDFGGSSDTFIRTDQLDGETDWKLRLPSPLTQKLSLDKFDKLVINAGPPQKNVHEFLGTVQIDLDAYKPPEMHDDPAAPRTGVQTSPLNVGNTAWASTVIASNTITYAAIIYTGPETRSAMSTSPSRSKVGLLEYEINNLTKILCILTLSLSVILVALEGFQPTNDKPWYIAIMIYLILFSTIIPMSLRVNLDMAKSMYGRFIEKDAGIPDTVVRTSTIPEDLGRVEYLLSDKTGTLTQNEMELRKIHVGTVSYANEAMDEVASYVRQGFAVSTAGEEQPSSTLVTATSVNVNPSTSGPMTRTRREIGSRVRDLILALALCHNVTPTTEEEDGERITTYQASSPDEIAIVRYTEAVGLRLVHRDRQSIILRSVDTGNVAVRVRILDIFPFTSDSKRMGIIVRFQGDEETKEDEIWFYQKGADTVMSSIVATNDWLDEETANMAREGLRTLVVGRKRLSPEHYQAFSQNYKEASLAFQGRDTRMANVMNEYLENNLELLGITGVEDKLQKDVKASLELLRDAGVKVWMLTGDKVETARCVAISSKLVNRGQYIHTVSKVQDAAGAQDSLNFMRNKKDCALLIDGESLSLMLTRFREEFASAVVELPAVIACRCSPTQKADIALLIRNFTKKRVCCIGDGGNDVSMIQAADVGIGIVGKEGRQASLAADFSITQFHHLTKLLFWHGRNSYKRSAKLAQVLMHRGVIISACQTVFSIASLFDPKGLFINWLLVGYATIYTSAPIFALVFDRDVDENLANLYPELYKELKEGRSLSYRSFFKWLGISIYQGCVIQGLSQILLARIEGPRLISVSFTALIINELLMVAICITTWHPVMIFSILATALIYFGSFPFLGDYFDLRYVVTLGWLWRVCAVAAASVLPVWIGQIIATVVSPPSYRKVRG
ncbi:putative aminophospholipid-translocase [Ascosphaera atra]|nr:putative aminophospholipid-translocase [Ascosphaera atra]